MQKSDYAILKKNIRDFKNFVNDSLVYSVEGFKRFQPSQFVDLDGMLKVFERFPDMANLEEVKKIKEALELAKKPPPLFGSDKYMKEAGKIVWPNTRPIIVEAERLAQSIKQPKDPTKKDTMIQLIRKYLSRRSESNETAILQTLEVLNGFKSWDPDLEAEDEFVNAMEELHSYQSSSYLSARGHIEALVGKIKADYNIKEDEIEKPEEVLMLEREVATAREELRKVEERNKILLQQLLSPPQVPPPQAPEQKPVPRFEETNVEEVEGLIVDLLELVTYATTLEEGKIELKVPIEQIERIYSSIKDALENTEYIVLLGQAKNILDNVYSFHDDPVGMLNITKAYVQNVRLEFARYHRRMERKEGLRRHM